MPATHQDPIKNHKHFESLGKYKDIAAALPLISYSGLHVQSAVRPDFLILISLGTTSCSHIVKRLTEAGRGAVRHSECGKRTNLWAEWPWFWRAWEHIQGEAGGGGGSKAGQGGARILSQCLPCPTKLPCTFPSGTGETQRCLVKTFGEAFAIQTVSVLSAWASRKPLWADGATKSLSRAFGLTSKPLSSVSELRAGVSDNYGDLSSRWVSIRRSLVIRLDLFFMGKSFAQVSFHCMLYKSPRVPLATTTSGVSKNNSA